MRLVGTCLLGFLTLAGCSRTYLPRGDVEAGRVAFQEMGCPACHRVRGEAFPAPVADPPLPFVLGSAGDRKSREYLAESIIAPSHQFARPQPRLLSEHPFGGVEAQEYKNVREGDESRMGDCGDNLTVRRWLDLVEFLDAVQKRPPGRE